MVTVEITPAELASGEITAAHLQEAVPAIQNDGFVVLKDVVDLAHIAVLRERMFADVAALMARKDAPYNWNTGNIQQDPPPFPPYLFKDVLLNEMVIAVTKAVLGPRVKNAFYSGNTAVRSEQRQPVHADTGHLWYNMETPTPPFGLVVNVPVVDMAPENGSTEIWPGSHRDTSVCIHDGHIEVSEAALAHRRTIAPPIQPHVSAGSILIRDIRLWHAGVPNRTDTPRPMIAMIHWANWYGYVDTLKFPKGTEEFFQHKDLVTSCVFVDEPIDYIHAPHAYSYQQEETEE